MTKLYPQSPTDWTTALEKIYAKQSEQLQRHHDQLRQRDQQMVTKAQNENITRVFGSLAKFSSTVSSAVEAGKKRNETWKEKYKLGLSTSRDWLQHSETIDKIRELRYKEEKEKVSHQPEIDKLVSILRKDGENSAAFDLLNVSGRRLAAQNELLAQNAAAGHTVASMRNFYEDNGLHDKVKEFDTNNKNEAYIRGMLYEYQHDRLAHLNLNDDAIAGILGRELKRQRDTAGGTTKAKANAAVSDQDDIRILTLLETANNVGTLEEKIWSVRKSLVKEGKFQEYTDADGKVVTVNQQVDKYLFETLNDLSHDGLINTYQLQPYIDSGFRHPAGKDGKSTPGEILFNKEQVNRLIKSAQFGESRYVSVRTQLDKTRLAEIQARRSQGIETKEDSEALDKIAQRGLVSDESVKNVRDINVQDNTPEAYIEEKEDWEIELENGNIVASKQAAKLIKNKDLRDEVLDKIKLHEKARKRWNYSERWLDTKVSEGMDLTLKDEDPLNQRGLKVRNDLLDYLRKDFQRRIEADPDNPNAFNESIQAVEEYWLANGGKNKGQKAVTKGKFTVTDSGRYEAYDKYSGFVSSRRKNALLGSTKTNVNIWSTDVDDAYKWAEKNPHLGGTTLARTAMMPGLLSTEDIIGAYENGILSQEIIIKARRMGLSGTALLKAQTAALQASEAASDPPINSLSVLSEDQINNFPNHEEALADAIKRSRKGDLLYLYRIGPENWSPKQFQRVRNELAGQAEFQHNVKTQAEEGMNQIEEDRRPETYKGATY